MDQTNILRNLAICLPVVLFSVNAGYGQAPGFPAQPKPVTTTLPKYHPIARAACVQGTVAVLVEVDPKGVVTGTDVLYGHPLLRKVAESTAREWTFDTSTESAQRREVLRFVYSILPFEVPEKKLKPVWITPTQVEIRVHPSEPACDDCTEKRRRQLRRGGCPQTSSSAGNL